MFLSRCLGVDGCAAGWLMASADGKTATSQTGIEVSFALAETWNEVITLLHGDGGAQIVAVDMPIGLSDAGARGCDLEARKLLPKERKSSVFAPPRRYMLGCKDWAEANALGKTREGKGLSHQAWNIAAKIAEIDTLMTPDDQDRVIEAHPELIFHRLSGGEPLPGKKSAEGRDRRIALLREQGLAASEDWFARFPRSQVAMDDYLDAAACLLLASNRLAGRARCLPETPRRDGRGLAMEIWY